MKKTIKNKPKSVKSVVKKAQKSINLFDDRERERFPFNWCDKWCEHCKQSYKCEVYQSEQERALEHSAEGRDPTDLEVILEDVEKSFKKMNEMLKRDMKKQGIDYKKAVKEAEKIKIEFIEPPDFDLVKKAENYMQKVSLFIDVLLDRMQFNPYLDKKIKKDVEVLNWYHTMLPVKLRRVLDSLWETKTENGEDNEILIKDVYWTSDIVFKSINLSKQALENILIHEPGSEDTVQNLYSKLKETEDELIKILDIALGKYLKIDVLKPIIHKEIVI